MQENKARINSGAPNRGSSGPAAAKAPEASASDLKNKILSSLSPIDAPNLIHSELKKNERLGFDHINRKYFTSELDGIHTKDQLLAIQE